MKTTLYWLAILASGTLFGLGLSISSMIQPEVILSFLRFEDFGLFLVLGGATGLTMIFYQFAPGFLKKPLLADQFKQKPITPMKRTLLGALIFGIGWGICGVCPGPAIAGLGAGNWPLLIVLLAMLTGAYVQGRWFSGN
ncbi:MAG: DUF6691 family protein [Methylococcaceae bacterium]|jgi:uncharacterized membrane protein YedE/YeeE